MQARYRPSILPDRNHPATYELISPEGVGLRVVGARPPVMGRGAKLPAAPPGSLGSMVLVVHIADPRIDRLCGGSGACGDCRESKDKKLSFPRGANGTSSSGVSDVRTTFRIVILEGVLQHPNLGSVSARSNEWNHFIVNGDEALHIEVIEGGENGRGFKYVCDGGKCASTLAVLEDHETYQVLVPSCGHEESCPQFKRECLDGQAVAIVPVVPLSDVCQRSDQASRVEGHGACGRIKFLHLSIEEPSDWSGGLTNIRGKITNGSLAESLEQTLPLTLRPGKFLGLALHSVCCLFV